MEINTFIQSIKEGKTYRMEYKTKSGKPYIVEWHIIKVSDKSIRYTQTKISYKYDKTVDEIKTMSPGDWSCNDTKYIMNLFTGKWNKPYDRNHVINLVKSDFLEYDIEGNLL